jgi:hypothetical protein
MNDSSPPDAPPTSRPSEGWPSASRAQARKRTAILALQARLLGRRRNLERDEECPCDLYIDGKEQQRCAALGLPRVAYALLRAARAAAGAEWAQPIEVLFPLPRAAEVPCVPSFDEGIDAQSSMAIAVLLYASLWGRVAFHVAPPPSTPADPISSVHLGCVDHLARPGVLGAAPAALWRTEERATAHPPGDGALLDELSAHVSFHRLLRREPARAPGYDPATYAHVVDFLSGMSKHWLARCIVAGHSRSVERVHERAALTNRFRALVTVGNREAAERVAERLVTGEDPACVYEVAAWRARNGGASDALIRSVSRALAATVGATSHEHPALERTSVGKLLTCLALLHWRSGDAPRARSLLTAALERPDLSSRDRGVIAWRLGELLVDGGKRHDADALLDAHACELGGLGLLVRLRHDHGAAEDGERWERIGWRWRRALHDELARSQRDLAPAIILASRSAGDWSVARAIALLSMRPAALELVDGLAG